MNRAPFALFLLLCTLASSMVAAGVANDRPEAARKKSDVKAKPVSPLMPPKYAAKPPRRSDWLSEVGLSPIDVHRYLVWANDQLPIASLEIPGTRLPVKIEEPKPAIKPEGKPEPKLPTKAVAAVKVEAKPQATLAAMQPATPQTRVACSMARPVFDLTHTTTLRPQMPPSLDSRQLNEVLAKATRAASRPKCDDKENQSVAKVDNRPTRVTLGPSKLRIRFATLGTNEWTNPTWFVPPYASQGGAMILGSASASPGKVVVTLKLADAYKPTTITVDPTWVEVQWAELATFAGQAAREVELMVKWVRTTHGMTVRQIAIQAQGWYRRVNLIQQSVIDGSINLYRSVSLPSWAYFGARNEVRSAQRPETAESR